MLKVLCNRGVLAFSVLIGAARFGVSALLVTTLTDFLIDWNLKFANYVNPVTYGPIAVDAINTAYARGYELTAPLRIYIRDNATITLTSEEKRIMNIKDSGIHHGLLPVPKDAPVLVCISKEPFILHMLALNPANAYKRAKPDGVDAFGIKMAIVDEGAAPPREEDYITLDEETETAFELLFTTEQVGKLAYIIGYYINPRGEAGPDGFVYIVKIV